MEPVGLCARVTPIGSALPSPSSESSFPITSTRVSDSQALFRKHTPWAESIAEGVSRGMPPSFDIDDLKQVARIEHWHRVELFDPSRGVPYRAYAYFPIKGAVLMACRRRNYREATHEQLGPAHEDERASPEELLLAREERRNRLGPREYRQCRKVKLALESLVADDAQLVRRVYFEHADVEELERTAPGTKRRLTRAVGRLRRAVARLSAGRADALQHPPPLIGRVAAVEAMA